MAEDKGLGAKDIIEGVWELAQIIMMIVGLKGVSDAKTKEEIRETVKQHLPSLFGFGHKDEGIWGSLRTALTAEERTALDKIMCKLAADNVGEVIAFLINVGAMPNEHFINDKGKEESVCEFSEKDRRVLFLKKLAEDAKMCATDKDVEEAIKNLRANRFLEESKLSKIQKEIKNVIFDFLEIDSWSKINDAKLASKIDAVTDEIEAFRKERKEERRKASFWGRGQIRAQSLFNALMSKLRLKEVAK